mmetsp:Transcript_8987/g.29782  ORF Transcript_8987/g.29782 Transcript_8987/m.29782 type:complete len:391 (-) Transcript_8987:575-1747(-)
MPSEWRSSSDPTSHPNLENMETFITLNHAADHGDHHPKSAHLAASSTGAYGLGNRCMAHGGSQSCQGPYNQNEENVKAAEVSDWDPAATLAALSGTSNDQNAAGLLAELGSVAGEAQPSMSAGAAAGAYADLRIRFVDQEVHRTVTDPATCTTENEVSNLRPFKLTIAVRTTSNEPPTVSHLMLKVSLVVESPDAGVQAVQPFLSQEDARSPLLVGVDGSPAQAVPVKPDGLATFTLKLGKNALSSKVNNRRFSLLVQLDLPVEQLANSPNLMVLSPPFKGLTRLRLRAGDARADRVAAGLELGGPPERLLVEEDPVTEVAPILANTANTMMIKRPHASGVPSMSDLHQLLLETRRLLEETRQENVELRDRVARLEERGDDRAYKQARHV